jgi:hypothetical protein
MSILFISQISSGYCLATGTSYTLKATTQQIKVIPRICWIMDNLFYIWWETNNTKTTIQWYLFRRYKALILTFTRQTNAERTALKEIATTENTLFRNRFSILLHNGCRCPFYSANRRKSKWNAFNYPHGKVATASLVR